MTSYSIFWDISTTPLWSDFPLTDFVLTLENKLYPKSKPVRGDCSIFIDKSSDLELNIEKFGSRLETCGFELIEYTFRQSNDEVIRVCEKYSGKSEITDLVLISGDCDFLLKLYYTCDISKNFNLISADKSVKELGLTSKMIMFNDIVRETISKVSFKTEHDDSRNRSQKTEENAKKDASKAKTGEQDARELHETPATSTMPDKVEVPLDKIEKYEENNKLRFMCLMTFDSDRKNKLMNTFDSCLDAFKGRVAACGSGVCVLEFSSISDLTHAKRFLCSLNPISGLRMNSITMIDRNSGKTLDFNHGEKVSNQLGENKSDKVSTVNKELTMNIEPHSDKAVNKEVKSDNTVKNNGNCTTSPIKSAIYSNSKDDGSQKPGDWDFLKNGYFLTFTDLVIDERVSWYRSQIIKLLGGIPVKFIYFHVTSNWAMIEFNSDDDRNAAQNILRGKKFPGKKAALNPIYASSISNRRIKIIKGHWWDYNRVKNTVAEKPKS